MTEALYLNRRKLALKALLTKWLNPLELVGQPCVYCYDAESVCDNCQCPKEVCQDDASIGLIHEYREHNLHNSLSELNIQDDDITWVKIARAIQNDYLRLLERSNNYIRLTDEAKKEAEKRRIDQTHIWAYIDHPNICIHEKNEFIRDNDHLNEEEKTFFLNYIRRNKGEE